jgi:hypothetical protein
MIDLFFLITVEILVWSILDIAKKLSEHSNGGMSMMGNQTARSRCSDQTLSNRFYKSDHHDSGFTDFEIEL